jgi:hypothetical protein
MIGPSRADGGSSAPRIDGHALDKHAYRLEPDALPRWPQIIAGVLLLPPGLFLLAASIAMAIDPPPKSPVLAATIGLVFVMTCVWILALAVRLIADRPRRGGLMAPTELRICATLFMVLRAGAVFNGAHDELGLMTLVHSAFYLLIAGTLWGMARERGAPEEADPTPLPVPMRLEPERAGILVGAGEPIEFRGVEMVPDWPERIRAAQRIPTCHIGGRDLPRLRYVDPNDGEEPDPCFDCGVIDGEIHVPGCDEEVCPVCSRWLWRDCKCRASDIEV